MHKILWVGGIAGKIGGQSRVALFTIKQLQALNYEVHCAGKGTQVIDEGEQLPCPCYEFNEFDPSKLYSLLDQIKPDAILLSHDVWIYYFLPELKQKYPQIPVVGWYTIDAHPIHYSWFAILRATDHICVSTQFGKKTIYERFPESGVEVVRYGVDRTIYNLN